MANDEHGFPHRIGVDACVNDRTPTVLIDAGAFDGRVVISFALCVIHGKSLRWFKSSPRIGVVHRSGLRLSLLTCQDEHHEIEEGTH